MYKCIQILKGFLFPSSVLYFLIIIYRFFNIQIKIYFTKIYECGTVVPINERSNIFQITWNFEQYFFLKEKTSYMQIYFQVLVKS